MQAHTHLQTRTQTQRLSSNTDNYTDRHCQTVAQTQTQTPQHHIVTHTQSRSLFITHAQSHAVDIARSGGRQRHTDTQTARHGQTQQTDRNAGAYRRRLTQRHSSIKHTHRHADVRARTCMHKTETLTKKRTHPCFSWHTAVHTYTHIHTPPHTHTHTHTHTHA